MSDQVVAFRILIAVLGLIVFIVGLSGVPGDIDTWRKWIFKMLSFLDQNNARWLLVIFGMILVWFSSPRQIVDYFRGVSQPVVVLSPIRGATLPRATPDELASKEIKDKSFYLYDVQRDETVLSVIRGRTFTNCEIFGPAIMAPLTRANFIDTTFSMSLDDPEDKNALTTGMFWEKQGGALPWGAIQIDHCTFRDCRIHLVGIAGDAALLKAFENLPLNANGEVN